MNPASNQKRFLCAAAAFTTLYLCVVLLGLPLIFTNFYFNITETKQALFHIASGCYLLLILLARIAFPPDYGVSKSRVPLHPAALALAALFVVSVIEPTFVMLEYAIVQLVVPGIWYAVYIETIPSESGYSAMLG